MVNFDPTRCFVEDLEVNADVVALVPGGYLYYYCCCAAVVIISYSHFKVFFFLAVTLKDLPYHSIDKAPSSHLFN